MKTAEISKFFAYSVSFLTTGVGVLILSGLILSAGIPGNVRLIFGTVLILLGLYRFILARTQRRQSRGINE